MHLTRKTILILIAINIVMRVIIMLSTSLGIDEVYYVMYALYPNISHFDHPSAVGTLIRLSTVNLSFVFHDFFVRLGSLLISIANMYLIYKIGCLLKNEMTGLISALLYSVSFYASIIVGTFILPDTPLSLFWLLAQLSFLYFIKNPALNKKWLILFGIIIGFGLVSKYQAIFLWGGAGLYLLMYNRKVLFKPTFWLSVVISLLIFSPILYWNFTSEYSGFNYHSERVGGSSWLPSFKHFFPELFGQIFYNNPFNVAVIVIALIGLFKQGLKQMNHNTVFLLCTSVPLIVVTLFMSLYNKTMPHWSGPAYFSLILIAAYLNNQSKKVSTKLIWISVCFYYLVLVVALFQLKTGTFSLSQSDKIERIGRDDFTVDLGLWKQIGAEIKKKVDTDESKRSKKIDCILTHNWFPGAHIDYYYALPNNKKVYVMGDYKKKHEYLRINKKRGTIARHTDVYYITTSNYYQAPDENLLNKFKQVETEIIPIKMNDKTKVNLFIWTLIDLSEDINPSAL